MEKTEKISLIEGLFEPIEAKEILISILTNKIQFHQLKNFSLVERLGKEDENSKRRIPELKNSIEQMLEIISRANELNKRIKISSVINIQLTE